MENPLKPAQDIARLLTEFIVNEVAPAKPSTPPGPNDPIVEAGLVDSLGLFKVIAFAEDEFGVRIAPEEILMENFATVNAIVRLIRSKRPA